MSQTELTQTIEAAAQDAAERARKVLKNPQKMQKPKAITQPKEPETPEEIRWFP